MKFITVASIAFNAMFLSGIAIGGTLAIQEDIAKKQQVQIDISASVANAIRQEQIQCMATNIYFETRSVSLADAMSVSDVVLNRVASNDYPNSVCEVVYDSVLVNGKPAKNKCQFSWYCDGKSDNPKDTEAWDRAMKFASDMIIHSKYRGVTEGSTHYHASYVKPYWAPTLDRVARIGSHIFYRAKGSK